MPLSREFRSHAGGLTDRRLSDAFAELELAVADGRRRAGESMLEEKARAERSFSEFVRLMFPVLEPGRAFLRGWAVDAICDHLAAVESGQIRKLLVTVPPNFAKSILTDVLFPAWVWGPRGRPEKRFISASYAEELTIRNNRNCRDVMRSDLYQQLWGDVFQFAHDQDAKPLFANDHRGYKFATHVGGATGQRGDFAILDDPHNIQDAESDVIREGVVTWCTETWPMRIFDALSAFVTIMQRTHTRDFAGHCVDKDLGWTHLDLPMEYESDRPKKASIIGFSDPRKVDGELLWPERFPREYVEEKKRDLVSKGGEFAVAAQFQQRPVPRGGGLFKVERVGRVPEAPADPSIRVRGYDLAASKRRESPWTVGAKLSLEFCAGDKVKIYVEDVVRIQGDAFEVDKLLRACAEGDEAGTLHDVPQDPGQAGKAQILSLATMFAGYRFTYSPESGDKVMRAEPFANMVNAGNVVLVEGRWNDAFLRELELFPMGHWKDQVDACSRAFARMLPTIRQGSAVGSPIVLSGP